MISLSLFLSLFPVSLSQSFSVSLQRNNLLMLYILMMKYFTLNNILGAAHIIKYFSSIHERNLLTLSSFGGVYSLTVIVIEHRHQVQILDDAVCTSLHTKALGIDMN